MISPKRIKTTLDKIKGPGRSIVSGPFGSNICAKFFVPEGVPVIRGNNLSLGTNGPRFFEEDFVFLTKEKADELSSSEALPGDLIFTARGTIGQVGVIPRVSKYPRYILSANQLRFRPDNKIADSVYLYYWFSQPNLVFYMQGLNQGSALPNMNLGTMKSLPVNLPPLPEQRAIAEVLSALDDKIELNRRMNQILEQLAQAIYKHMFIDNQARDKWEVKELSEICVTQYGYTASAQSEKVGPKLLRITDMNKDPWIDWIDVPYCSISSKDYLKYALNIGDVLVSRMADPGKAAIIEVEIEAVFASYLVRLKSNNSAYSYYIFYFLRSNEYLDYSEGAKSGSVQSGMNAKVITGARLLIPPEQLIITFNSQIAPIRQKIQANLKENNTITEIRDILLPKLMSGQVRVKPGRGDS